MSLWARIYNRDVPLLKCKIGTFQNKAGTIDLVVPIVPFMQGFSSERVLRETLRYQNVEIYNGDVLVKSGYIKDVLPATAGKVNGFLAISCDDEVGKLSLIWSKPDAHYQDVSIVSIMSDLLTIADDWELGDTSTMDDPAITTTINVRSKDRLWAQIVAVAESVPNVYVRYGGVNEISGNYKLDVGFFGEQSDSRYAYESYNIAEIKQKRTPTELIRKIRPKGGKAGAIIIKLTGSETVPSGFSILFDVGTQEYYIQNDNLSSGVEIARTYREIRTDNSTTPKAAQLAEARQALADRTVKELMASSESETLTLSCSLKSIPLISQNIRIRSKIDTPSYDILTDRVTYTNVRDVDGYYRITKIDFDWNDEWEQSVPMLDKDKQMKTYNLQLEVTDGIEASEYDEVMFLAKRLETHDDDEPFGAGIGLGGSYIIAVNHNGVASDCIVGGVAAKLFQFDYDPLPSTAIQAITYQVLDVDNGGNYNENQAPALPSTPLILCVTGTGGGAWNAGENTTVTIEYTYFT